MPGRNSSRGLKAPIQDFEVTVKEDEGDGSNGVIRALEAILREM